MANPKHLAILKWDVEIWNDLRRGNLSHDEANEMLRLHGLDGMTKEEYEEFKREPDLSEADLAGENLIGANLGQVNLRRATLTGAILKGAKLEGTNLEGAFLIGSKLGGAILWGANLRGAVLIRANLEGADLRSADLTDAMCSGVEYDHDEKYQGIILTSYDNQLFKRFALDQAYLEEFQVKRPIAYRMWLYSSNCGRSFWRWLGFSGIIAVVFACIFYSLGDNAFYINGVDIADAYGNFTQHLGLPHGLVTMLYYSVVTFTTLGFGDVTPLTRTASILVMAEVVLGYLMLGGLISIFANKLARRSS